MGKYGLNLLFSVARTAEPRTGLRESKIMKICLYLPKKRLQAFVCLISVKENLDSFQTKYTRFTYIVGNKGINCNL